MAGDYGKIDVSAYAHNGMTPERVTELETAVAEWLENAPGSFMSKGATGMYEKALRSFKKHSGRQVSCDDFEIALSRLGYRAGVCVYDGNPRWFILLPSSIDATLERMAASEARA